MKLGTVLLLGTLLIVPLYYLLTTVEKPKFPQYPDFAEKGGSSDKGDGQPGGVDIDDKLQQMLSGGGARFRNDTEIVPAIITATICIVGSICFLPAVLSKKRSNESEEQDQAEKSEVKPLVQGVHWPGEASLALSIGIILPNCHYSLRFGFWRMYRVLKGSGLPVTVFADPEALEAAPEVVKASHNADWEIALLVPGSAKQRAGSSKDKRQSSKSLLVTEIASAAQKLKELTNISPKGVLVQGWGLKPEGLGADVGRELFSAQFLRSGSANEDKDGKILPDEEAEKEDGPSGATGDKADSNLTGLCYDASGIGEQPFLIGSTSSGHVVVPQPPLPTDPTIAATIASFATPGALEGSGLVGEQSLPHRWMEWSQRNEQPLLLSLNLDPQVHGQVGNELHWIVHEFQEMKAHNAPIWFCTRAEAATYWMAGVCESS